MHKITILGVIAGLALASTVVASERASEPVVVVINNHNGRAEIGDEDYAMSQCRFWSDAKVKNECRVAKTCSYMGYAAVVRAPSSYGSGYWMQAGCGSNLSALESDLLDSCRRNGKSGCEIRKTARVR